MAYKKNSGNNIENNISQNLDNIAVNTKNLKEIIGQSSDIVFREVYINANKDLRITILLVEGMVDIKVVNDDILKPLLQEPRLSEVKNSKEIITLIEHGAVYASVIKVHDKVKDLIGDILGGSTALIFDSENKAITFETKGFDKRGITEPATENALNAPNDSFVETIRTNTSIVRRRIKSENLVLEDIIVGKRTATKVSMMYMRGIANDRIIRELKKRLQSIEIDAVTSVGSITEYVSDNFITPFPMSVMTERPDKFCANILEGRAGVLVDGQPLGLTYPAVLAEFLQSTDDYSKKLVFGSYIDILRYILFITSIFLPAIYVATTTYNQEMLPVNLTFSIASSRIGVPFPSALEILILVIAFELILEAGLRLPRIVGQAVSIVGALIVGEAAVRASLVSPIVIIIVAVTGISSFALPSHEISQATRIVRIIMIILASIFGLYGVSIGFLLIIYHFATLESFGVPYLAPFAGNESKDLKDTIIRIPIPWMKNRPTFLKPLDTKRKK